MIDLQVKEYLHLCRNFIIRIYYHYSATLKQPESK